MDNATSSANSPVDISLDVKFTLYIFFLVLGLAGNITLLSVVVRRHTLKEVFEILVINLSVADVLFHLLYIAPNIYRFADNKFTISEFHCKFLYPFSTVAYCSQIFTITAMSLHRYWVIVYSYKAKPSTRAALIWIFIIWISSFIMAVPLIVVSEPVPPEDCYESWPSSGHRKAYTVSLFLIQYAIPLGIIAAAYSRVALFLVRDPGNQVSKMNLQVVKTTSTIVIIFAICMLPSQLSWIIVDFAHEKINQQTLQIVWTAGDLALCLHATLDPVVYGVFVKRFRKAYIEYFCLLLCCFRKEWTTPLSQEPIELQNDEDITLDRINGQNRAVYISNV